MIFKKLAISISNTFKTSFSVKSVILIYAGKKKIDSAKINFPRGYGTVIQQFTENWVLPAPSNGP